MKTTLDLPDDLIRAVKMRAVEENRKLKDVIADLLRRGLTQKRGAPVTARKRLKLPLVECAHEALPGEEMTPERVAEVLLEEESGAYREKGQSRTNTDRQGRSLRDRQFIVLVCPCWSVSVRAHRPRPAAHLISCRSERSRARPMKITGEVPPKAPAMA